MKWNTAVVGAALSMVTVAGCGDLEPYEDGAAELSWEVAPVGCEEGGVDTVEVALASGDTEEEQRIDCATGSLRFDGITPGLWEAEFRGKDADGISRYSAHIEDVMVRPGLVTEVDRVDLVALTGGAKIEWTLPSGMDCASEGLESLELAVFNESNHEVYRRSVACDGLEAAIDGLHGGQHLFRLRAGERRTPLEAVETVQIEAGVDIDVMLELAPQPAP